MRGAPVAVLLASSPTFLGACAPALPARGGDAPPPAALVVNISQWPGRHSLATLLRERSAPLVVYDGATLGTLPGCTLSGPVSARPPRPDLERGGRWITTSEDLEAGFPLRDPSIRIVANGDPKVASPVLWRWIVTEERSLRALDHNTLPSSEACAGATHAVTGARFGAALVRRPGPASPSAERSDPFGDPIGLDLLLERCAPDGRFVAPNVPFEGVDAGPCSEPLFLTLAPLGHAVALETATRLSVTPPHDEDWSMSVEEGQERPLPAEHWLMPGTTATLRRKGDGARLHFTAGPHGGERVFGIAYEKDRAHPWAGLGMSVGGAAMAAAGFGLLAAGATGSDPPSPGSSSGGAGRAAQSLETVAGLALLGSLGAAVTVGGLAYLATGPRPIPVLRRGAPPAAQGGSAARGGRASPLKVTPAGIAVRF